MPINFDTHVSARLGDYLGRGVQWQRRLWRIGAVLMLREVTEACDAVREGALKEPLVEAFAKRTQRLLRDDPGIVAPVRSVLLRTLSENLTAGGAAQKTLQLAADNLEPVYLDRLAASLQSNPQPSPETFAVALASHLLDLGVSRSRLHTWFNELGSAVPAVDVIDAAKTLVENGPDEFEVMLLVSTNTRTKVPRPPTWRTRGEAARWLVAQGVKQRPRQAGGLLVPVRAWDAEHAVSQANDLAARLEARAAVGTKDEIPLAFHLEAYVACHKHPFPLRRRRRTEVRVLERQARLFDMTAPTRVDSALELLANLDLAPSPVAVAGGWSAVEALLTAPGDRGNGVAADRLAALVACSWPRAELTTLGWARANQAGGANEALAERLRATQTNREKAELVLDAIKNGTDLGLARPADQAAVERMRRLLGDPTRTLSAVRTHVSDTLQRLYRQRNIVLHGGQTQTVALEATLRTAAPLVGAGLDRVTHAFLVHGRDPLETATRAEYRLSTIDSPDAPSVLALFDDP